MVFNTTFLNFQNLKHIYLRNNLRTLNLSFVGKTQPKQLQYTSDVYSNKSFNNFVYLAHFVFIVSTCTSTTTTMRVLIQ